ncbi:MAG: ribosome silencing factor [Phycisphaerae bacterium]|nr:ribosome silencing factor [Phycisphaerae bacterium]
MATKATKKKDVARQWAIQSARLLADNKCEDVIVLDLAGKSPVTDYFVIATGTSDRQMRSAAADLADLGKQHDNAPWHVAGMDSADWVVLDFVDVVVHLFDASHRRYYDLELIWGEAKRVRWQRVTRKKKEATDEPAE